MGPALLDATDDDNRITSVEGAVLRVEPANQKYGNVAHQVEQRIENPCVAGSSPAVPTSYFSRLETSKDGFILMQSDVRCVLFLFSML